MKTNSKISLAIETSCRRGGVALGIDSKLNETRDIGTSGRHASELVAQIDEMLAQHGLEHNDVDELYISVGPGSFTGLRVGITAARVWGQLRPELKIVAVPTPLGIAENFADEKWTNMAVLLAAKEKTVHATLLNNDAGTIKIAGDSELIEPAELIKKWPQPLLLAGEGLGFVKGNDDLQLTDGVTIAPENQWLPTASGIWQAGNKLALAGEFTPFDKLLPIYARRPEAVRLWEKRNG